MLITLAAAALACGIEHARYSLRTAPDVSAQFLAVESRPDWPGGLAFRIHMRRTRRDYWFLPWGGGTDDRQHLASTLDVRTPGWAPPSPDGGPRPQGDVDYIAVDAAYTVLTNLPKHGDRAPAHILLPNLGDALWRQPALLEPRDGAPRQFFDLIGCAK